MLRNEECPHSWPCEFLMCFLGAEYYKEIKIKLYFLINTIIEGILYHLTSLFFPEVNTYRVVSTHGGNTQWYTILSSKSDNPRWQVSHSNIHMGLTFIIRSLSILPGSFGSLSSSIVPSFINSQLQSICCSATIQYLSSVHNSALSNVTIAVPISTNTGIVVH